MNFHAVAKRITPKHSRDSVRHVNRGVTLVELIVGVSVLAVLLGLAIPSFSTLHSNWRRDSAIRDFMGDLQLARSTALRTSREVVMCVSLNHNTCANDGDWRQSWIVFSDRNGNNARDNGEPIVVQRGPMAGLQRMSTDNSVGLVAFRSNGLLKRGSNTFEVWADGANPQEPMGILINRTGRTYLVKLEGDVP